MQVSISDLCPFFCRASELEGKTFKSVRKREMMSPFTLFYNKQEIIELAKLNERLYVASPDRLVFKRYSKVEANLERTLLKVSFNDVQILKGIFDRMFHMLNQEYLRLVEEHGNLDSPSQVKELSFFEKQLIKETKQKSSIA
jgi:DNA polymerase I-like protein with 3'-5' exonuclease and polymerase domains